VFVNKHINSVIMFSIDSVMQNILGFKIFRRKFKPIIFRRFSYANKEILTQNLGKDHNV